MYIVLPIPYGSVNLKCSKNLKPQTLVPKIQHPGLAWVARSRRPFDILWIQQASWDPWLRLGSMSTCIGIIKTYASGHMAAGIYAMHGLYIVYRELGKLLLYRWSIYIEDYNYNMSKRNQVFTLSALYMQPISQVMPGVPEDFVLTVLLVIWTSGLYDLKEAVSLFCTASTGGGCVEFENGNVVRSTTGWSSLLVEQWILAAFVYVACVQQSSISSTTRLGMKSMGRHAATSRTLHLIRDSGHLLRIARQACISRFACRCNSRVPESEK